jgi:hypothetical protein
LINFFDLFHNTLNMTWIAPFLNYMNPLMHVHTYHQPYGYPFFMLCSWQRMHKNPWCSSWHLCCHCARCWLPHGVRTTTCVFFKHVQFFLLTSRNCVHQRWHSHFSRCCHCQPNMNGSPSRILHHPRIWCFQCNSSQKTKLSWLTPCQSIPLLSNGGIWMFT